MSSEKSRELARGQVKGLHGHHNQPPPFRSPLGRMNTINFLKPGRIVMRDDEEWRIWPSLPDPDLVKDWDFSRPAPKQVKYESK